MSAPEEDQREDIENGAVESTEATTPIKRKLSEDDSSVTNEINKRRKSEEDAEPSTSTQNVIVKTEPTEAAEAEEPTNEVDPSVIIPVQIKPEPEQENDDSGANVTVASTSTNAPPAIAVRKEVKKEPATDSGQSAAVSSSTLRPSCTFGIRCYRRNPAHRNAEAHPGDTDYRRPSFPAPPLGTPACPFGNICYRRNPMHFQQYSHPPDFNSDQNIRNRLRQRRAQTQNAGRNDYSDIETDEEEDPFGDEGDSDLDYKPGANLDDADEEDDELEFSSERQNCDEYD